MSSETTFNLEFTIEVEGTVNEGITTKNAIDIISEQMSDALSDGFSHDDVSTSNIIISEPEIIET